MRTLFDALDEHEKLTKELEELKQSKLTAHQRHWNEIQQEEKKLKEKISRLNAEIWDRTK